MSLFLFLSGTSPRRYCQTDAVKSGEGFWKNKKMGVGLYIEGKIQTFEHYDVLERAHALFTIAFKCYFKPFINIFINWQPLTFR